MKISNETLQILKNFATINTNMILRPGKQLATMATAKNVFAVADIAEEIPRTVAIYDLNSLLALLTLGEGSEIEFGEESLNITIEGGGEFEYFYSDERLVTAAPPAGKTIQIDEHYKFDLSASDVQTIQKAIAITASPHLFVIREDGEVTLSVQDKKNKKANSFKKKLGSSEGPGFTAILDVSLFKIIPDSYNVTVSAKRFMHFKHATKPVQYWLALDTDSAFVS
jgi:hypothetical protein